MFTNSSLLAHLSKSLLAHLSKSLLVRPATCCRHQRKFTSAFFRHYSNSLLSMADSPDRILSVQSHVVSGYVGNKAATFPLQLLGFEVDAINSVQFSNHTGYPKGIRGQVLDDKQLWELVKGLQENEIDFYSHVINGYIGSDSFLIKLAEVIEVLKKKNPKLIYVCDPVMGDFGPGMYVPESLMPIYRERIIPMADVCLPNQFEAELLTGHKISTQSEALSAMRRLHELGAPTVILSSAEIDGDLVALASTSGSPTAFRIGIPRVPAAFVGTGDLFTALCTAWLHRGSGDGGGGGGNGLADMLEKTIATMQAVLRRTLTYAEAAAKRTGRDNPHPSQMELRLIQSKGEIENPKVVIRAEKINTDEKV